MDSTLSVFWTVALNGLLGAAGYDVARFGLRQPRGLARGLGAAVVAWAWADLGMDLMGGIGRIGRWPLLGWTVGGFVAARLCRMRGASRGDTEGDVAVDPGGRLGVAAILAMGMVLWVSLLLGARSLLGPVKVVSDGPIYHLYFAARWWKEGAVFPIAAPFGENAATYFPAVGDLWFTWLLTCWGGERLAKVGQVPFALVAGLACYAMSRRLGAARDPAVLATTWFLTSTPLIVFTFEPNVDTIFIAGYLVSAYFFLRATLGDEGGDGALGLGGLAAGGALGTKVVGVVFVPVLLVLAVGSIVSRKAPRGRLAARLAIVVLSPLVMAGSWYARNLWRTGNPLYPLHLVVGGRAWLSGWYGPGAMVRSPYYIPRGDWCALLDLFLAILDPRLAPCWLAGVLGAWAVGRRRDRVDRWVWWAAGLSVVDLALYWVVIPYRTQQRFALHALGLAAVPLARLMDRGRWFVAAGLALLVLHLTTPQEWPFDTASGIPWDFSPLVPTASPALIAFPSSLAQIRALGLNPVAGLGLLANLGLGVGAAAATWAWCRLGEGPSRRGLARAIGLSVALLGISWTLLAPRVNDARRLFFPAFPDYEAGWLNLDLRAGPRGARIAYSGTDLPYYLLGVGLRNEVRYINVDGREGWLVHDYHREAKAAGRPTWPDPRPGWDRLRPSYEPWLAAMRGEGIQILVVARANPAEGRHNIADAEGFPIERQWADSHPEAFEPIYGLREHDPKLRIYRVVGADAAASP